jgi:hypothetical protein
MRIKPWFATCALGLLIAAAPQPQNQEARLEALTKTAASYRLLVDGERPAELIEKPAIRWSKPAGEIEDAALFFWMCDGRPVAAGSFLWQKRVGFYHEFQSLIPGSIRGERGGHSVWATAEPGIRFAPVPDAPIPAESSNRRLIQMRAMAESFRAEAVKEPPFYGKHSVYKFRLLAKPLLRYDDAKPDGAIFAFVQDTDPEVLLVLQSHPHENGTRWEYAFAPMTGWQLKAWHKEQEVWSIGNRHPGHDPSKPYFVAGPFPSRAASNAKE